MPYITAPTAAAAQTPAPTAIGSLLLPDLVLSDFAGFFFSNGIFPPVTCIASIVYLPDFMVTFAV